MNIYLNNRDRNSRDKFFLLIIISNNKKEFEFNYELNFLKS